MTPHYLFLTLLIFSSTRIIASQNDATIYNCTALETFINKKCRCLPPNIQVDGVCRSSCPESSYPDWTTYTCQACHSTCLDCWGPESYQCLSCHPASVDPLFSVYDAESQRCGSIDDCAVGSVPGLDFCLYGSPSCSSFVGSSSLYLDSTQELCSATCTTDVFGLPDSQVSVCRASQCDPTCGSSSGTRNAECLGVQDGWSCLACDTSVNIQIPVSETSIRLQRVILYKCVNPLPDNAIYLNSVQSYYYCSKDCWTCEGAPDSCTACSNQAYYLTEDGSCVAECPVGTIITTLAGGQIGCISGSAPSGTDVPVSDASNADGSQSSQGNSAVQGENLAGKPSKDSQISIAASNDFKFSASVAQYNKVAGTVISVGLVGRQIVNSGSSSTASTILLINLLQYIRYISINYPPNLVQTFNEQPAATGSLNFGPLFPKSLENDVLEYEAPYRFSRFEVYGLFLANFWREITTSAILAICACVMLPIRKITFKYPILNKVKGKIQSFLLWNYIIAFILSNLDRVNLFAVIEYSDLRLDSAISIASLIMSILFLGLSLLLLGYIPKKLYDLRKENSSKSLEVKIKDHDSIKVLFQDSKDKYYLQELFLFLIGCQVVLNNTIIAAMDNPIVQCSLLLVINVFSLAYFVVFQPCGELLDNVELIFYETIVMTVNIICTYLSTLARDEQFSARDAGLAIMACNIIALGFSLFMTFLRILIPIVKILKEKLAARRKAKNVKEVKVEITNELAKETNGVCDKDASSQKDKENGGEEEGRQDDDEGDNVEEDDKEEEEEDIIKSLEGSIHIEAGTERGLAEIGEILGIKPNPSQHVVDRRDYPSLGIPVENVEAARMNKYFGDQAQSRESMTNLNIHSDS